MLQYVKGTVGEERGTALERTGSSGPNSGGIVLQAMEEIKRQRREEVDMSFGLLGQL